MIGGAEILFLVAIIAVVFLLPRLQKRLEQGVDEDALGRKALKDLSQKTTIRRLQQGEAPDIINRFMRARRMRIPRYTVHLTEEETVNALALPGGTVLLTAGLMALRAKGSMSEDELAAVLAHEVGHIELGHSRKQQVRATMSHWATMAAPPMSGALGRMAMTAGMTALQRRASRDAEQEADAWAVKLLTEAGYDPKALEVFLARTAGWSRSGGLWSTHPSPADRIEALRELT
jgi:metalloprotease